MAHSIDIIAARAEALFASDLPAGSRPSRHQTDAAIVHAVRTHGGVRGCLAELATRYGDQPDTAARRMYWARTTVEALYPAPSGRPITRPAA